MAGDFFDVAPPSFRELRGRNAARRWARRRLPGDRQICLVAFAIRRFVARAKCREAGECGRAVRWPGLRLPWPSSESGADRIPRGHTSAESSPSPNSTRSPTRIFRPGAPELPILSGDRSAVSEELRFRRTEIRASSGDCGRAFRRGPPNGGQTAGPGLHVRCLQRSVHRPAGARERMKRRILPGLLLAIQNQHARGIPLIERALSDLLGRKIEVEVGKAHD